MSDLVTDLVGRGVVILPREGSADITATAKGTVRAVAFTSFREGSRGDNSQTTDLVFVLLVEIYGGGFRTVLAHECEPIVTTTPEGT